MKGLRKVWLLGVVYVLMALCVFFENGVKIYAKNSSGNTFEKLAFNPASKGAGFSAVLYDNQNGLPTSEANAIAETGEGFLWIGSYSGLYRYDGNTFLRISSTEGISSVICLYVDSKDRLWIGTSDHGVAVMEKGSFFIFDTDKGLKSSYIRSITEGNDGNIYIASTQGLNYIEAGDVEKLIEELSSQKGEDSGKSDYIKEFDSRQLGTEIITELHVSAEGTIYGETDDGDIFTISNGTLNGFYGADTFEIGSVKSVFPDPKKEGYVYIGTNGSGLYHGRLDGSFKEVEKTDVYPLGVIASIESFEDQIIICCDNGVGIVDSTGVTVLDNIPLNNSIEHVMADYEGNLWFTSSRQGLMKIAPNRFTDIFKKFDLKSTVVNSTCLYNNLLFIGADADTGLIVIDLEKECRVTELPISFKDLGDSFASYTNLLELLEKCRIRSIIKDSKDRLWFSTYNCDRGLVVYDHGEVIRFDDKNGLPKNKVRAVYERSDGIFMVACSGGMVLIKDDKVVRVYDDTVGITNKEILTVTEGYNGDMIVGSDGSGIYIIRDQSITNLGKKDGLNSEVVMRIKRDEARRIFWIVTSNSISFMTEDYKITTVKQFPYSNNFDLYENKKGDMWILSSNGVHVIPLEEMLNSGDKELSPILFSMDNGLPTVATANSYSALDENGNLYISGTTGVARVNIDEDMLDVNNIKMAVPYVEADGNIIYPDEKGRFNISSDVNKVTIYNYVFAYSLINPQITYWLDGFDKELKTISRKEMNPVEYTNLEGGTYHFVMILHDALGKGNKQLDIVIVKAKAFYEKAWFKILLFVGAFAAIGVLLGFIVKRKTRLLSKKNEQNRLFINEMTQAFAKTIDMKDKYTNGHSQRVAEYTAMLTKELGYDDETVERYKNIALLHDIGKISIPPEVLNKEGKLTDQEFKIIKSHSAQGYMALKDISIMPELAVGAGQHHERPDGKGYPKGLKGDQISRVAQIIAVADTFDAMYSDRPYRKRMNFEKAVSIIKEVSGTQLTEDVVDAFLRIVERGGLRAEDDNGGGSTEDIDNIHKKQG